MTKRDLAALISARICHDLISPIGAIGNGIELLMLDPAHAATPETRLIAESAAHASARIRLFRIAFGKGDPEQFIARGEVEQILATLSGLGRHRIDWQSDRSLSRLEVKRAFLALLCLESGLGVEGVIEMVQQAKGWSGRARSERMRFDPELWALFGADEGAEGLDPRHVQFALLAEDLRESGKAVEIGTEPKEIRLSWD